MKRMLVLAYWTLLIICPGCSTSGGGDGTGDGSTATNTATSGGSAGSTSGNMTNSTATACATGGLAAFPGAEGFGACATGGRGGRVIYVTNLNANGPGSFQAAVDEQGARYVLFKVSGVIEGDVQLTSSDVTIAGETSPGGIIVRGFHTTEEPYCDTPCQPQRHADNWIMRHIRSRPGIGGLDDGLRLLHTRRVVVDHCSFANATDESVQVSYSNDVTIQNCMLSETLGEHAPFGGMLLNYSDPPNGFELDRLSIHHNAWNRIEGRMPELSRESPDAGGTTMHIELANNLLFDPGYFIHVSTDTQVAGYQTIYYQLNFVGNLSYARAGFAYGLLAFTPTDPPPAGTTTYFQDNHINLYADRQDYALVYCCNDFPTAAPSGAAPSYTRSTRHDFPPITYTPAANLLAYMAANVGAFPRDPIDRRLTAPLQTGVISETPRNANPADDAFGLDFNPSAPPAAPTDTDNDGIPDDWETIHGLDPSTPDHNGTSLSLPITGVTGYTNLEVYLNELAAHRVSGP